MILICVPTPLTRHRDPDLRFVVQTAETIAPHLRAGQLVVRARRSEFVPDGGNQGVPQIMAGHEPRREHARIGELRVGPVFPNADRADRKAPSRQSRREISQQSRPEAQNIGDANRPCAVVAKGGPGQGGELVHV